MNERQRYALENPLKRADDFSLVTRLTRDDELAGGNLLRTVLAIDR